jgi:multiple sugar transport system permease protein
MSRRKTRSMLGNFLVTIVLSLGTVVMVAPFLWALSTSLKIPGKEFGYPPEWIPWPVTLNNYVQAFQTLPFSRFFANSFKITAIVTAARLFLASLAGYTFAKLRFRGRDFLMLVVLATMMVPRAVILIPEYLLMFYLGWVDTHLPLIIPPSLFFAYGIFLMRQFYITIPDELQDSGKMDGCSSFQVYLHIIMPLARTALATMAVISFMWTWNSFMEPLIYINTTKRMTVMLGLGIFVGQYGTQWRLLMAGTVAAVVPILALFTVLQRYYVQGISLTGIKG